MLASRNLRASQELGRQLQAINLCQPFLDKPPRLIGAGSYNDVFVVRFRGHSLVLRLSYYSPYTLGKVQALIRQHLPYKQLLQRAHAVTAQDPVTVKNNYSRLCNLLIEHGVCPHFVYLYHQKDAKCFAATVKEQVKPERAKNNLSFRYNNVSFHERFQACLRLKLRQLSDLQLTVAVFQVMFALAVLQHYVPSFRHNDLSLDNVLISIGTPQAQAVHHYRLKGMDFWVPDVGVFCAVTDFDLAHAPATVVPAGPGGKPYGLHNQLIAKDQFGNHSDVQARNINAKPNSSFDTNYFLFRLKEALGARPSSVQGWLAGHTVLKQQAGAKYVSEAFPTLYPAVVLANAPMFQQFRRPPPDSATISAVYQPTKLPVQIVEDSGQRVRASGLAPGSERQLQRKVTVQSVLGQAAG